MRYSKEIICGALDVINRPRISIKMSRVSYSCSEVSKKKKKNESEREEEMKRIRRKERIKTALNDSNGT